MSSDGRKRSDGYCEHGVYVGGCGIDWMCGYCETGDVKPEPRHITRHDDRRYMSSSEASMIRRYATAHDISISAVISMFGPFMESDDLSRTFAGIG